MTPSPVDARPAGATPASVRVPAAGRPDVPASRGDGVLGVLAGGLRFQNPLLLAAGTAAYGRELAGAVALERLGGLATKAVSLAPRSGAPAPRVAEFPGGMINAVGLANPGVDEVRRTELPWLAEHVRAPRVLVNVVGFAVEEYAEVVARLDDAGGFHGYELNVSCPNVKAGGMEFGADATTLADVVRRVRARTRRPIFVKLSPALPDIVGSARTAAEAGADGLTLVNTLPGLLVDVERRRPVLGFGSGGVSGAALLPVGVLATWKVTRAVPLPVIGLGGVGSATDALQYLMAGASLVGVGTAAMRDPRLPTRIVRDLARWCERHGIPSITDVVGTLEWPG
ncbi:MAG TPA: dihydroorotate dehydrogenase [Gemmatimonadaceae bacterium]|nr:dihydroorotate dehydrogenase [Gemmatimonadaceae bacterium]